MKFYVGILCAIYILSLAGSAFGVACPLAQDQGAENLNDIMQERIGECIVKVGDFDLKAVAEIFSGDSELPIFREYCERQELVKNCLSTSSACPNEEQRNAVGFVEDILKTALDYACMEDQHHLTCLMNGVFQTPNATAERNLVTECFADAKKKAVEDNSSTRMLGFYREINAFKQCLVYQVNAVNNGAAFGAEVIINGVLHSMRCPRPEDGTKVLCETMDNSPDDQVCPYKGECNGGAAPESRLFIDYALLCIRLNFNQLDFNMYNVTSMDEHKQFFNTFCQNRPIIYNCLSDILLTSMVCQNQSNHQVQEIFVDFLEHVFESGCKRNGEIFATLFSGVGNHAEHAVTKETANACVDTAQQQLLSGSNESVSDSGSYKTMRAYNVLVNLKQCVLDGAEDVGSFRAVLDSAANEVLRAQKCIHPLVRGVSVPCSTLYSD